MEKLVQIDPEAKSMESAMRGWMAAGVGRDAAGDAAMALAGLALFLKELRETPLQSAQKEGKREVRYSGNQKDEQ